MPLNIPVAPALSDATSSTVLITVKPDGNPSGTTYYAFKVVSMAGTQYVNAFGVLVGSPVWILADSLTITGLTVSTLYNISLSAATDAIGTGQTTFGPSSAVVTPNIYPPTTPSISSITSSGFTITKGVDANPVGTFYLYMISYNTSIFYADGVGSLSSTPVYLEASSVSVAQLPPNTVASVSLAAASDSEGDNLTGFGPAVGPATLATPPLMQPYQAIFSTTVTAYWLPNGNPTGTEYYVQLSTDPSFTSGVLNSGWITNQTYQFINLLPSTIYYGRVKARNLVSVETVYILLGMVTTLAGPANVRALQVTNLLDNRGFLLQWAPNIENNIVAYKVYRSNSPTDISSFALINSTAGNITSYIDNVPFTFGITYYYIVTALDSGGNESSLDTANPTQDMSFHSFEEQPFPTVILVSDVINNETPSGLVNGTNTLFTTAYPFKKNTVSVYVNGVQSLLTTDYILLPPQQFQFLSPPGLSDIIRISYVRY